MGNSSLRLNLLENSHSFLQEAVKNALESIADNKRWQFAILHLTQSLELSLKALLNNIHPILIYEDIDRPNITVKPRDALKRLENPKIGNLTFSDLEKRQIEKSIELRNRMTHSEFELPSEYAAAKFFHLFAFVSYFQARHLKTEVETIIESSDFDKLIQIEKGREELAEKAKRRLNDEEIRPELIWACPGCLEETFVIQDDINTCYTCRQTQEVVECTHCKSYFLSDEMIDFSDEIDSDYEEGLAIIHNSYGFDKFSACPVCIHKIREYIAHQRQQDFYHQMEMEHYYK